ncbi:MAG: allantoinase AllB [Myxococcales bacterium]|nr:allantoinase AllB [Myxococcales bacterium]
MELVVRARRVITPEGTRAASVHVAHGRIAAVAAWDAVPAGVPLVDAGDDTVLMPGVVDTHVHINEPGRTEWEGFATATQAAAAGGVTALVDMPLNSVPATTTLAALREKRRAAEGQLFVDVGFWGGVVPGNTGELAGMAAAGAIGFKCFLVESGVAEFGFVREAELRPAMVELARLRSQLLVHAELPGPIDAAALEQARTRPDPRRYATYLASRPRAAEDQAVALMIALCRDTGARTHVVHHASSDSLPAIAGARAAGLPFSAETCPHYLSFAAEEIPDGATAWKCAPPIRERANRELLWQALRDGTLGLVASDHSPCTPALKQQERGDFAAAWGGISGLQLALSVVWTEARARGFGLEDVVRWMCAAPAALAGVSLHKGRIAVGADADLVLLRDEATFAVAPERVLHRHKITPYAGRTLAGVVESTWLRGRRVWHRGKLEGQPAGRTFSRGAA